MSKDECRHIWWLVGLPPSTQPETREFVCDQCGAVLIETCDVGRSDPYTLDPFREAVGGVVQDVLELEIWLRLLASEVMELAERDRSAGSKVRDMPPSGHVKVLRDLAPANLDAEHVATLLALLDRADEVLLARHHLVHGIWLSNQHGTALWAQKSGRRGERFTQQRFTRRSLLELHVQVTRLAGSFQSLATTLLNDRRYAWPDDHE